MVRSCPVCASSNTDRDGRCPRHPKPRSPSSKATGHRRHKVRRAKLKGLPCYICGEPIAPGDLHADHVLPRSKGGPDTLANLAPTHSWCNLKKGNR